MEQVTDQMLLQAIRQRIMDQIASREQMAPIINNVYGAGPSARSQGVSDMMSASGQDTPSSKGDKDPYEYMVDIQRRNIYDPEDPEKVVGWDKNVRRYRQLMGEL